MKTIGTVNYATTQGLGILTRDFVRGRVIDKILVIEHDSRETHHEWYPGAPTASARDKARINLLGKALIDSCDAMFFIETPFDWELINYCKNQGKPAVLMPMYECMPKVLPAVPSKFINPSKLDKQYFDGPFLPVPVFYPWKQRTKAEVFLHNAGHGGLRGRNGSIEFITSLEHTKTPLTAILQSQSESIIRYALGRYPESDKIAVSAGKGGATFQIRAGEIDYNRLFEGADVFVFPEKFNGLSLPLQEARAAGLLVMCGDRFPMNDWLPKEPLIPIRGHVRSQVSPRCLEFDEAIITPIDIAATMDAWYGQDITAYSRSGQEWAMTNSWPMWTNRYRSEILR